jgi:hypothetical protein
MNTKFGLGLFLVVAVLASVILLRYSRDRSLATEPVPAEAQLASPQVQPTPSESTPAAAPTAMTPVEAAVAPVTAKPAAVPANKLERLSEIRTRFVALAAGDPTLALRDAKAITDETERETALQTLVTEWTQGELGPARQRARAIAAYGIEAGLGLELSKNPQLAVLWANELTEGRGQLALLQHAAGALVDTDPAAAFALSQQLGADERRHFSDSTFARWASSDTESALKYAEQIFDANEREAAIQAIRTAAPVGIGASMTMRGGYPVIQNLVPGAPAELSGQLQPGDRIVGLAQGDNSFVEARGMPLEKIVEQIRGAPSTMLQLQVISADAPPNSAPRIVSLARNQVKFKRSPL